MTQNQQEEQQEEDITTVDRFSDLGVDDWIIRQLSSLQITKPTFIQAMSLPPIFQRKGVIGVAETGSGKTAAFAIPILQELAKDLYGVFSVVITASRELGYQIADQFVALGSPLGIRVSIVIGGVRHDKQLEAIQNARPHIVVATPGRFKMILESFTDQVIPAFRNTRFVVLDEADRLLENEMEIDTMQCLKFLCDDARKKKKSTGRPHSFPQLLMFTATATPKLSYPSEVWKLAGLEEEEKVENEKEENENSSSQQKTSSSSPVVLVGQAKLLAYSSESSSKDGLTAAIPSTITQTVVWVPHVVKLPFLVVSLRHRKDKSIIVFTNSCVRCELVRMTLQLLGFPVCSLNSLLNQKQRLENLALFKTGISKILVATDVAARGLDIPQANLVVHYDFPKLTAMYIHRTGRTGRAGAQGESLAIVTESEKYFLQRLDNRIHGGIARDRARQMRIDEHEELLSIMDDVSFAKVSGKAHLVEEFGDKIRIAKEVSSTEDYRQARRRKIETDGGFKKKHHHQNNNYNDNNQQQQHQEQYQGQEDQEENNQQQQQQKRNKRRTVSSSSASTSNTASAVDSFSGSSQQQQQQQQQQKTTFTKTKKVRRQRGEE